MHQRTPDIEGMLCGLESYGLSRTEIARATGLSRQTIWRFACGQARAPTLESYRRLKRLAAQVGVTRDWKP
ncbi:MAG: helix-turn-helix transcriptional regulator [Vicinamibacterales bacterium]